MPEAAEMAPSLSELFYIPVGLAIMFCGIGLVLNFFESWPVSGTSDSWRALPRHFADAIKESLPAYVAVILLAVIAELGVLAWWFRDDLNIVAIGHIGGAILAVVALVVIGSLIGRWDGQRIQRRALEDASIELGVSVEELDNEELVPKLFQFLSSRYSGEFLRNRLSDFCGILLTLWRWCGSLIQYGILVGVLWYAFTDSPAVAIYAWWIVVVALFFWITSIALSFLCRLFTGRYPGEAKEGRTLLVKWRIEQRTGRNDCDELYGDAP